MNKSPYTYIFRFCCDPGFNDRQEIASLNRYAEEALVDNVAVFANVEEMNTGHMEEAEQETYLAMMREIAALMAEKGISLSVNQWHSVMHADLGKKLLTTQNFRRMVDPYGHEAELCVCPLCENWQRYIGGVYAKYASLPNTELLWVEDDFRLHNHDPLVWGGCFCEEHMRLYSERAGKKLTREEFVRGVLQKGEVHSYRKIWLDVSRETMLSAARAIEGAVHAVSPQMQIGLMSSVPFVHAAEGRDWKRLLHTLCGDNAPVDRVHLPAYQEQVPSKYMQKFNMVSLQNAFLLPKGTEIYPELENYPYSLFSKSLRFTRFQFLTSLALNLHGMTIDLYDLNGNGIVFEENYQHMLAEVKPFLSRMQSSGAFQGEREGVQVLCCGDSSYTLHTTKGEGMEELYPQEVFFAGLLGAYGIAFRYSDMDGLKPGAVAVSGQVLRNYPREAIVKLFAEHVVLLNGDAADTLCDLGLGHLAGIKALRWMPQNNGEHTYEQTLGEAEYLGRKQARASTVISCSDALRIEYSEEAKVEALSAFHDSFRRETALGQTLVNSKVILFPFGHFEAPDEIPVMLLNSLRQKLMQKLLKRAGCAPMMVENCPNVIPYAFRREKERFLYLVNAEMDDVRHLEIHCPFAFESLTASFSKGGEARNIPFRREGESILLDLELPSMETVLLSFGESEEIQQ